MWLNRQIVEAAFSNIIGKPCLRIGQREFKGILVSDAGGKFRVTNDTRAGGLIRTAIRSTDILMDRVWQLELDAFENTPGILFMPLLDVVERSQDAFAQSPEIQRQAARIRTDLDHFSDLEISTLVQHGYCVARKTCRNQTSFLECETPRHAPWDPFAKGESESRPERRHEQRATDDARELQIARRLRYSSMRRIGRTLLSFRDWPSYLWVSLVALLVIGAFCVVSRAIERAQQQRVVLAAIAEMSPSYKAILDLMHSGPKADFDGLPYLEVESMEEPTTAGFDVLSDDRIYDLRGWSDASGATPAVAYSRLRVRRLPDNFENTHLRVQRETVDSTTVITTDTRRLNPILTRMANSSGTFTWELDLDLSHVPANGYADVNLAWTLTKELASEVADEGRFNFTVAAETDIIQVWILMPEGREYDSFQVSGHPVGQPGETQTVVPHSTVQLPFGSIATFRMINPTARFCYECRWTWTDD